MNPLLRFLEYGADFEKTLADDDWSRLEPYFCADAIYRVEAESFGCELSGWGPIFAGMKKSLDGFDRHFESRDIQVHPDLEVGEDELRATWTITYHAPGEPDFLLHGKSFVRLCDNRISLLVDSYDPSVDRAIAEWNREVGVNLDPAYM